MKPRVIIIDDHAAVLRQTAELISDCFEIVHALEDPAQVAAAVQNSRPDLIVLDISLPGTSGLQLAAQLRQSGCTAKIVFLSAHADIDYAREAFAIGAVAYVVKSRLASDLIPALQAAVLGQRFVSPCPELEDL